MAPGGNIISLPTGPVKYANGREAKVGDFVVGPDVAGNPVHGLVTVVNQAGRTLRLVGVPLAAVAGGALQIEDAYALAMQVPRLDHDLALALRENEALRAAVPTVTPAASKPPPAPEPVREPDNAPGAAAQAIGPMPMPAAPVQAEPGAPGTEAHTAGEQAPGCGPS